MYATSLAKTLANTLAHNLAHNQVPSQVHNLASHRCAKAMQSENTNPIEVDVKALYIDSESDPEQNRYIFAYTVTIKNVGDKAAKLMTRHWVIRDANGKVQEVQGDGVVGEQPHLKPGEGFQYTSGTMLETSMGTMGGSYQMITDDGAEFKAPIAEFLLSTPRTLH